MSTPRTPYGPGLVGATSRALVSVESSVEVGWSRQLTCIVDDLVVLDEDTALLHRRGRYAKP